jgi:hypothetical protein
LTNLVTTDIGRIRIQDTRRSDPLSFASREQSDSDFVRRKTSEIIFYLSDELLRERFKKQTVMIREKTEILAPTYNLNKIF